MLKIRQNLRSLFRKSLVQTDIKEDPSPGQNVSNASRSSAKTHLFPQDSFHLSDSIPGLRKAIQDMRVIDITLSGAQVPSESDGISNVITTILDPDHPSDGMRTLPPKQHYILLRGVLQLIPDYRGTIQSAFERLRVGGWLVITVPHQFLAERKFRLPSRYGTRALRIYTPATLIREIEEALDPTEYRLRLLCDDDTGYDYSVDIHEHARGNQRIVVAVQRIKRPSWADHLTVGDEPTEPYSASDRIPPKEQASAKTVIIAPETSAVWTILVVKLDHRGDYLMAAPAFSELRQRFPDARITFVCGSWNIEAARASGWFDEIVPFNFFAEDASLQREPKRDQMTLLFAKLMHGRTFDLAIDMRAFDDTRDLLQKVNARFKAGFDRWNNFPWLDITLTLPLPTIDGRAEQYDWPARDFRSPRPVSGHGILIPPTSLFRKPHIAVYGPYKTLKTGRYTLSLDLRSAQRQQVLVDVIQSEATKKLFVGHIAVGPEMCETIEFSVQDDAHDIEIRVNAPKWSGHVLDFRGARLVREGAIVGVHQLESMYLLVQLVSIRLTSPYTREIAEDAA